MEYGAITSVARHMQGSMVKRQFIGRLLWFQKNFRGWLDVLGTVDRLSFLRHHVIDSGMLLPLSYI